MIESDIEGYLRKRVEQAGGKCWKWVSPGRLGVPDRIVLMPGGIVAFVETKAPGKGERPAQLYVQRILRELGFSVYSSVDSRKKVDLLLVSLIPSELDNFSKIYGSPKNPVIEIFEQMNRGGDGK